MIPTLLYLIFVKMPKKVWQLLMILFSWLKKLTQFIFITIPKRIAIGFKVFLRFLNWAFVPNKKVAKKGGKRK